MRLKAQITVRAGVIPDVSMGEHMRVWQYTSEDFEADKKTPDDQPTIFSKCLNEAHEYAKGLSNPGFFNWVQVNWMWM